MSWATAILAFAVGYACGSISFARIVYGWKRPGETIPPMRVPSLDGEAELVIPNAVGGTTVMFQLGPRWGMLVSALDIAKAFLPTLAFRLLVPEPYYLIVAVAVVVGHIWPVWYRFVGGGGNSSTIGGLLAIDPLGLLVTQAAGGVVGMVFPVITFMAGNLFMLPWFWWRAGPTSPEMGYAIAVNLVYFAGQIPQTIGVVRMKRAGHPVDMTSVMREMRARSRKSSAAQDAGDAQEPFGAE